jgi:hypothetical protein
MLSDRELLSYNKRGIIPAPEEKEEEFVKRASFSSTDEKDPVAEEEWNDAHQKTQKLFDFKADWVKAFYNKNELPFWEGAVTWLTNPPSIQLNPRFKKGSYLKIYKRDEVLAHEAVHAVRTGLNSSKFEEHFAHQVAASAWKRWLGPLFSESWESALFLVLLVVSVFASYLSIWLAETAYLSYLPFLPWAFLVFCFIKMQRNHRTLKACRKKLTQLVKNPDHLLVRLTDEEIAFFAKAPLPEIQSYITEQKTSCLRWRMLSLSYL